MTTTATGHRAEGAAGQHEVGRGARLHQRHFVDAALLQRAVAAFGEAGVMDLVGVSGCYTLVSMVLKWPKSRCRGEWRRPW
ncbi:MAG: hypothetical protein AUG80_11500 [Candidatus Rokubacteria bacterium 13_1_20CM_4_68_9]|nr:MAG: hypothetical protein AUG80_11500 [Candidatus Rokubacteria bacterium 13_1_20CM_4_68_9]